MLLAKRSWLRDKGGNVAISAALCFPVVIGALALGVDYGYLTLQQRELQTTSDLAAISAAAKPTAPEKAVLDYFAINNKNMAVLKNGQLLNAGATVPFDPTTVFDRFEGYAEIAVGKYSADSSVPVPNRFQPGPATGDAIRVTLQQRAGLFFGGSIVAAPTLSASGTAASEKVAAFSIGTRLASLDGGILNALLGKLLGTTISLKAMDYQMLVDAQINVLKTLDALALDLGVQAGTYDALLKTEVNYGKLLSALGKSTGITPAASAVLKGLENTLNKTKVTVKLEKVLGLGPLSQRLIGQSDNLAVEASVFEIISAAATAANGGKQLSLDLNTSLLGLASASVSLAVGEPPVGTPALAAGTTGSVVRTAQTRIAVEVVVDGLSALLGLKVRLPVYLEVGYAEARLAAITCTNSAATVNVEAVPGVAEIALGNVDTSAFANFGTRPRVTRAALVSTLLLSVSGMANATATNISPTKLSFSPSDISQGKTKSISSQNTLTSLTSSLLGNLDVRIDLLGLPLVLPREIFAALGDTLKIATVPLDAILYNTLLALGIRIGEADVRVTDASCRNPVLVQ